jgi:hypothetical protein
MEVAVKNQPNAPSAGHRKPRLPGTTATLFFILLTGCVSPKIIDPPSNFSRNGEFRSGFETATVLSGAQRSPSDTWVESLTGLDESAGFTWPDDLPGGLSGSKFYYIVDGGEDIASIVETRIDDVIGHTGASTQALYQAVLADHQSMPSRARNMYSLQNNSRDDLKEGTVRYRLMLQSNLKDIMPGGAWRQIIEWREENNRYRKAVLILPDENTGVLYWRVHGDFGPGWDRDWTIDNRTISVPVGEWMLLEVYWKEDPGSAGRMVVRINGQIIADFSGRTRNNGPLESLHVFKVYTGAESLALGPAYQWVDDVELDSTLSFTP